VREALDRLLEGIGEGWRHLVSRASAALTRFTPRDDLEHASGALAPARANWGLLLTDLSEDGRQLVVRIEAPGMQRGDFEITVVEDVLRVRGEKRLQREEHAAHHHLVERAYGAFERVFRLPAAVDPDGANAAYHDGVLEIRLPKHQDRAGRAIPIQAD
jgi:HSP20 family protein